MIVYKLNNLDFSFGYQKKKKNRKYKNEYGIG